MYTLREFRASTKKAFDEAAAGETVTISRDGKEFLLSCVHNATQEPIERVHKEPVTRPIVPKLAQVVEEKAATGSLAFCKNGHPLDNRGKCFGKGCKYAK